MLKYSLIFLALISLFSCAEYNQEQQQLWDKVMVVHDEVMPKMGDMHRIKKKLKKQNLPNNPAIQQAIQDLDQAEEAMMNWMRNFKSMRKLSSMEHNTAMQYLQKEQKSIAEVKRLMQESMQKGTDLLQENS